MAKIWDVKRPLTKQKADDTDNLITELFMRGVTIERIFGQFYALEAMADARADEIFGNDEEGQHGGSPFGQHKPLTVGDALLAGVVSRDIPSGKAPF